MPPFIRTPLTRLGRKVWGAVACGVLAIGILWGWLAWQRPPLNVLIVTLDTTRADRVGAYGYRLAHTPVMDQLAAHGVLFEHAYTPAPLTLPAHASLFTGLYTPEHGLRTNGKDRLDDEIPTLAALLRKREYATGAFIASFVVDSKFGLDRGFRTYDDDLTGTTPADEALHRNRSGDRVVDQALNWLGEQAQKPFLCWVHLYDPHAPYDAHPELYGDRFQDRPYDAEIAFVDSQIGRLLEFLKAKQLSDRTLVIIVGDHGEGLDEHLERRHGQMLYNSTLQVPLIMSLPGKFPAGQRIATPVSLVDLCPTILEQLNVPLKSLVSGHSLIGLIQGKNFPRRGVYGETDEPFLESGWSPLRSLTTEKWKYIRTSSIELYDLVSDPSEKHNLAANHADQTQLLEKQLADLEQSLTRHQGAAVRLSPEEQRRLASLGYLGGQSSRDSTKQESGLLDIKDMIGHYNALEDAHHLIETGKWDAAEQSLTALVAAAPHYELAQIFLGDIYLHQRKLEAASQVYRSVLKRNPNSALAHCHLGDIQETQGQYSAALLHYEEALQREPDSAKLHYNLGRTLVLLGNDRESDSSFRDGIGTRSRARFRTGRTGHRPLSTRSTGRCFGAL